MRTLFLLAFPLLSLGCNNPTLDRCNICDTTENGEADGCPEECDGDCQDTCD